MNTEKVNKEVKMRRNRAEFLTTVRDLLITVIVVYLISCVIFNIVIVSGSSMEPTLENGEIFIASHLFINPEKGDIVVCNPENYGKQIVKRVIGTGGDTILIEGGSGNVYVNGELLTEEYIKEPIYMPSDATFEVTVDEGFVFVMGDNRNHSADSRIKEIGQIPLESIQGEYLFTLIH